jgi:hypothetical protein
MKQNQVLLIVTVVLGLVDFFSIPFYSLLVTVVFGIVLFALTKSLFLLALVFMTPLLIQLANKLLGVKQGFANPTEISNRLKDIKSKYSQGENLNPETPTKAQPFVDEYFTDLLEVSKRVEDINAKHKQPKVKSVSAIVDTTLPTGPLVQGLNATPAFMEQFENLGTNIETNTRIYTPSETSVPVAGTVDQYPVQHPAIEKLDTDGVNTALMRTTTNNNLTLKGVDINASPV